MEKCSVCGKEVVSFIIRSNTAGVVCYDCARSSQASSLPEAGTTAGSEAHDSLLAEVPSDEEIEQVACDEISGLDYDDLRFAREAEEGFVLGAKWAIRRIQNLNRIRKKN